MLHASAALPSGTHTIGGWVGPRVGLDDVEKRKFLILLGLELRFLGPFRRKQSWSNRGTIPVFARSDCVKALKLSVVTAGASTGIRSAAD
jgi:hypothetical protein